jgi:hypothetical protein
VPPGSEGRGVDRERSVAERPILALGRHRRPSKRSRSLARPPFTVLSAR